MIQHVCIGHKGISFVPIDRNAENARSHHHAIFTVLFQGELLVLRHLFADHLVIVGNILDLVRYLVLEGRTVQPRSLLLRVKNWEVRETLWQNVNELREARVRFTFLLHNKG